MSFVVIIPARYAASRLPGKPLSDIHGKPMIVRVLELAQKAGAQRVIVATDHPDVASAVAAAGGEVCITRVDHQSGTERLAEVVEHYQLSDETRIINVQGDEPLLPPVLIRQLAENLQHFQTAMATLAVPVTDPADIVNPNVVKVVLDCQGYALYFSRAPLPWDRQHFTSTAFSTALPDLSTAGYLRHIGIYGYQAGFIRRYVRWSPTALEKIEMLEQLRVLWQGEKIHVAVAKAIPGIGVDTPEDLQRVRQLFAQQENE